MACLDQVKGPLWGLGSSTYGTNDRIDEHAASSLGSSLKLVEAKDLKIIVGIEGAEFGNARRKVRGEFTIQSIPYLLSITDPIVEREYYQKTNGSYSVGHAILCLSLGEAHRGYAYKLVAGLILPTQI
jgi:hypothetical protein